MALTLFKNVKILLVEPRNPHSLIRRCYRLKIMLCDVTFRRQLTSGKTLLKLTNIEKDFQEKTFKEEPIKPPRQGKEEADTGKFKKYSLIVLGFATTVLGGYVFLEFGKPESEELDEFSELPVWKQYFFRCMKRVEQFTISIQEPSREKLLPDPFTYPYYQPPYTLVIEFTDVMVHPDWTYQTGWRFKKRPGLDYLLENLVGLYEIVVFTAEPGITIFPVIEALDQKNLISYKLVRDSTHFVDGHHVKNLDRLNRDLRKVVVIDWNSQSVKFHPDNLLNIPRWKGQDDDTALIDLTAFLKTIAVTEIEDVREVLRFYKQFDDPLATFREKQRKFYEQQELESQTPKSKTKNKSTLLGHLL